MNSKIEMENGSIKNSCDVATIVVTLQVTQTVF